MKTIISLLIVLGAAVCPVGVFAQEGAKTYTDSYMGLDFVEIKAGTFTMGCTAEQGSDCPDSGKPPHKVTLTQDYWMAKHEVTQLLWRKVMGANPSYTEDCDNCPVEGVSWEEVQTFLSKLRAQTGMEYRLPTEAEWEYAARAGQKAAAAGTKYAGSNTIDEVVWYKANSGKKAHAVGEKKPNGLGLYDMGGNVWELCADRYGPYTDAAATDPQGPAKGNSRVLRGGGWNGNELSSRLAFRLDFDASEVYADVGLRLCITGSKLHQYYTDVYTNMPFVRVQKGTFTMGCTSEQSNCSSNERPTHSVTLTKDYYMGKYEVTQAQWRKVMGSNPSRFKNCDNCPVEQVNWNDVQRFITRLNAELKKADPNTKLKYRLPTEAEWEYAARGGHKATSTKYAGSNSIGTVAWYSSNANRKTHPVGQKMANELGLYDMSGNVWEWCSDRYGSYSSGAKTDPKGPSTGRYRVLRGGSWNYFARHCRVSNRLLSSPVGRNSFFGFRLCLSL